MFNIGMPEMILILVIALVVVGPDRLPDVARSIGRLVGQLKTAIDGMKYDLEQEMDKHVGDELRDVERTLRDEADKLKAEADKLQTEADRLRAEAERTYTEAAADTAAVEGQQSAAADGAPLEHDAEPVATASDPKGGAAGTPAA